VDGKASLDVLDLFPLFISFILLVKESILSNSDRKLNGAMEANSIGSWAMEVRGRDSGVKISNWTKSWGLKP